MKMFMYSVEKKEGGPRMMFANYEEAAASRQPEEYVIEYHFVLEDSIPVVFPSSLVLRNDFGGEE